MRTKLFLTIFLCSLFVDFFGQCPPPEPMPVPICVFASFNTICAGFSDYCSSLMEVGPGDIFPFPGCPSNIINNPEWTSFLAWDDFIKFSITPSNCFNSAGIHAAIYSDCIGTVVASNCACTVDEIILEGEFEIGEQYFMVVDGCAGDFCDYEVKVVSGSNLPPIPSAPEEILGNRDVCSGNIFSYSVEGIEYADSYRWSIGPSYGNIVSPSQNSNSVDIEIINSGSFELCCSAVSLCDPYSSDETCITIVSDQLTVVNEDIIACGSQSITSICDTVVDLSLAGYQIFCIDSTGCPYQLEGSIYAVNYELMIDTLPITNPPTECATVSLEFPDSLSDMTVQFYYENDTVSFVSNIATVCEEGLYCFETVDVFGNTLCTDCFYWGTPPDTVSLLKCVDVDCIGFNGIDVCGLGDTLITVDNMGMDSSFVIHVQAVELDIHSIKTPNHPDSTVTLFAVSNNILEDDLELGVWVNEIGDTLGFGESLTVNESQIYCYLAYSDGYPVACETCIQVDSLVYGNHSCLGAEWLTNFSDQSFDAPTPSTQYDSLAILGSCLSGYSSYDLFTFIPKNTGTFEFILEPDDQTDYDFVLFEGNCASDFNIISCNFAGTIASSFTGISDDSLNNFGYSGPFTPTATLEACKQYFLLISNYNETNIGYEFQFSGTALINQVPVTYLETTLCEDECYLLGPLNDCEPGQYTNIYTDQYGCDSMVILDVLEVFPNQFTEFEVELCLGECLTVFNQIYCTAGDYSGVFTDVNGCDSVINYHLTYLSASNVLLDTLICSDQCLDIGGQTFCNSGNYTINLVNAAGCDSIININLQQLNIEAAIAPPAILDCNQNQQITLQGNITSNSMTGQVSQMWTGPAIIGAMDQLSATVTAPGEYCLTVTNDNNGQFCEDVQCVTVLANTDFPNMPNINGGNEACAGSALTFTVSPNGSIPNDFVWSSTPAAIITDIDANTIVIDFGLAGTYEICVAAENDCGLSSPACQTVAVILPTVNSSGGGLLCENSNDNFDVTLELTGDAPWQIEWTKDGIAQTPFFVNVSPFQWSFSTADAGLIEASTLTDANGCINHTPNISFEIALLPVPTATISGGGQICTGSGEEVSIQFDVTGEFPISLTYTNNGVSETIDNILSSPFMLIVDESGIGNYQIVSLTDNNGCTGLGSGDIVQVGLYDDLIVQNLMLSCDNLTNTTYTVSFEIAGGDQNSIMIYPNNGNISGSNPTVFTSNPIPAGTEYSFVVTDANNCVNTAIENLILDCPCLSQVGALEVSNISACADETAQVNYLGGEILDADDVLNFALFDQISGMALQLQDQIAFAFDATIMNLGQSYYVAALVGNDDGNGLVDLNDDCLSTSNFVEVVFNDLPSVVDVQIQTPICDGNATDVTVVFSGTAPFSFSFEGQMTTSNSNNFDTTIIVSQSNPTLDIENLSDGNNCMATNGLNVALMISSPPALSVSAIQNPICIGELVQLTASSDPNVLYEWQPNATLSCLDCANPIANPVTTTTYEVTALNVNGCSTTESITIEVAAPNIDFITPDTTVCSGQVASLEVISANAISYEWSPANGLSCIDCPNPQATITENIIYEVLVTDNNGCELTESVEIVQTCWLVFDEVKVGDIGYRELNYPPYELAALTDACNDIAPNAAINFTGGGVEPDSLLFVGEAAGKDTICLQFVHPQNSADVQILTIILQVREADIFNLTGSNHQDIVADGVLLDGIRHKAQLIEAALLVYPNPTKGSLLIESSLVLDRITLYDFSGQLIREYEPHQASIQIDMEAIAAGVYLVRMETAEQIWTEVVVKME